MTSTDHRPTRRRNKSKASTAQPRFLAVGKVLRPHGVRGELLLEVHTDSPTHLAEVETVYVGETHTPLRLEKSRLHRSQLLIKVGGYDDRATAESLRGEIIFVAITDAAPLKPGEYYHHQIIGLKVVTDEGEALGMVTEILETGANDVYVVNGPDGELLLPAIKSVILKIESGQIMVHLMEGLR
ncbi:MAG: 16S rRNA processing protein RimM [Chloroflexi bacterium]|nr:16S rRNA processing protein RimM [Chloroflexota bacterium]